MSRMNWADVDEDEDDLVADPATGKTGSTFVSRADKDGIKLIVSYLERNGQTIKVTKKVQITQVSNRTNQAIIGRKSMKKFGLAASNDAKSEAQLVVRSEEKVPIELTKKPAMQLATKDDVEEKFYEESLSVTEGLFKKKEAWTASRPAPEAESAGTAAPAEADKSKQDAAGAAAKDAPAAGAPNQPGRYVPPSLRNAQQGGKGGGKMDAATMQQQQEASLRITNLSEDVKEGDLQDLFGQCGRLQRVFLAKDPNTFQSKGFAFITYYNREDAQKAINKLNGHGYDNLILQVQWAKPRT